MAEALEPNLEHQEALLRHASRAVVAHAAEARRLTVTPTLSPHEIRARLAELDPEEPWAAERAVDWCVELLRDGIVHTTSPRYFGLFNPTPAFMGVVASLLVAAFNPQLASWSHSPAPVEVESWLLRYTGCRLGLGDRAGGCFTSGGAEANSTALHLAMTRAFSGFGEDGVRGLDAAPVMYASTESHMSWLKAAHLAGIGRRAVRLVPATETFQMNVAALEAMVAEDLRAGHRPTLVVGTAGTTAAGAIDPLSELAEVAGAAGAHYHVDAAWAGAAALSDVLRPVLAGIEAADSVTLDAHKWLSVPLDAGMFVTTHVEALRRTYHVEAPYMPAAVADTLDPYAASNQWSRPFRGLKVLLTLMTAGRAGYAAHLEAAVDLGDLLRQRLDEEGWLVRNRTPLPVVCVADAVSPDDQEHHRRLVDRVRATGSAWISLTELGGRPAIRACVTSHRTTADDIEHLVQSLGEARALEGHRAIRTA